MGREFVTYTLRPWMVKIEKSISRDLLLPSERGRYFAKFNADALLRGNTAERYEAYASAILNGWMSRNEVRELEDLNPEEGLDEFLVPLNMDDGTDDWDEEDDFDTGEDDPAEDDDGTDAFMRSEIAAIRVESGRLSDDEFDAWIDGYYSRLYTRMTDAGVKSMLAQLYCDKHADDLRDFGADGAIEKWMSVNPEARDG